jgi:hypothetical protein
VYIKQHVTKPVRRFILPCHGAAGQTHGARRAISAAAKGRLQKNKRRCASRELKWRSVPPTWAQPSNGHQRETSP